jgi:hypothetical protein
MEHNSLRHSRPNVKRDAVILTIEATKGLLKAGEGIANLMIVVIGRVDQANEYAELFKAHFTVVGKVMTQGYVPMVLVQQDGDITISFTYVTL